MYEYEKRWEQDRIDRIERQDHRGLDEPSNRRLRRLNTVDDTYRNRYVCFLSSVVFTIDLVST